MSQRRRTVRSRIGSKSLFLSPALAFYSIALEGQARSVDPRHDERLSVLVDLAETSRCSLITVIAVETAAVFVSRTASRRETPSDRPWARRRRSSRNLDRMALEVLGSTASTTRIGVLVGRRRAICCNASASGFPRVSPRFDCTSTRTLDRSISIPISSPGPPVSHDTLTGTSGTERCTHPKGDRASMYTHTNALTSACVSVPLKSAGPPIVVSSAKCSPNSGLRR